MREAERRNGSGADAGQGEKQSFSYHQAQDIAPCCPKRGPNAHLLCSPADRIRENTIDSHGREHEGDGREDAQH